MAEPPGRFEGGPAGKAARAFESASQATPQRPESGVLSRAQAD